MSRRELAEALGSSVGGTHYVLKELIKKGLVKLGNFTAAEDKRRYACVLTPKGIKNKSLMIGKSLKRKLTGNEAPKQEIKALRQKFRTSTANYQKR